MIQAPPDSWIEREETGPPMDMEIRCDGCERVMPDYTESGHCVICELEYKAAHQLTVPVKGKLETQAEIQSLVDQVGPEAAGLVFILNKLEESLRPKT